MGNPICTRMFGHDLITVHPLGGCVMGENAFLGAVDHAGQVFAGTVGSDVHEGLFVADGSVIPTSLGTNPLLTICATAERTMALIAEERGWSIRLRAALHRTKRDKVADAPSLHFTETMTGTLSIGGSDDVQQAAVLGEEESSSFRLHPDRCQRRLGVDAFRPAAPGPTLRNG